MALCKHDREASIPRKFPRREEHFLSNVGYLGIRPEERTLEEISEQLLFVYVILRIFPWWQFAPSTAVSNPLIILYMMLLETI